MDFYDKLIDLRITLSSCCDGFSVEESSKNLLLSHRIKVLHLLNQRDMMQYEFINYLGMAKSNLANLLKSMVQEGVIENYRNSNKPKNIYYKVTELGSLKFQEYKRSLKNIFLAVCPCPEGRLENNIDDILKILKGE